MVDEETYEQAVDRAGVVQLPDNENLLASGLPDPLSGQVDDDDSSEVSR